MHDTTSNLLLLLILGGIAKLMATFDEFKAQLTAIQTGVDGLEAKIRDLKDQVAAGHVITQAELDELFNLATSIGVDIADDSDTN